jgi:hypothetical protein
MAMRQNFAIWGKFSWPLIIGAATFLFAITNGNSLLNGGDTFWHLATGRWILEHGAIPHSDSFSHTFVGKPWTSHEWLSEVILYLAYQAGGWFGVAVLTSAMFAAVLAYLARFLLRYLEPAQVLIFCILALGMVAPHLLARPHVLAMPLLVIWTAGLIRACEERRMPRLWLLAAMVVWANLHGGFTLGIALTAAFGIEALLLAKDGTERFVAARQWAIFLTLSCLAGALTPHGLEGYFFTVKLLGMSYALSNIDEWLSPNFQKLQFLELWLMLLLLALFTRGLRLSPVRLAILLGLVHLSLSHVRNIELLGLLSPMLLASAIGVQWASFRTGTRHTEALDKFFNRHAEPASLPAILVVVLLVGALSSYKLLQQEIAPPQEIHPIAAVEAMKKLDIKGPVFNDYSFGGYLIFSGIPVFIDGRADMYGDDFLRRYREAYRLPRSNGLDKLLDEYHVCWTILRPNSPAVDYLDSAPGWRRIYSDRTAVIHVRDSGNLKK